MTKYYESPSFKMKFTNCIVLLFFGLILNMALPAVSYAQPSGTQAKSISDTLLFKKESPTIPLSSVASEGQNAALKIRDIKTRTGAVSLDMNVDSLLQKTNHTFTTLKNTAFKNQELKNVRFHSLKDYYRDFSQIKIQLNNIKSRIIDKYNMLQPDLEQTALLEKKWQLTKTSLSTDDVPKPIRDRINSMLKDIKALSTEISDKQNKYLVYEDHVTTMMISIDEVLDKINVQIQIENEAYFKQTSPPIWRELLADDDTISLRNRSLESFQSQKKDLQAFYKNYTDSIQQQLTFLFLFFFFMLFVKKRLKNQALDNEDKKLNAAKYIINLPFVSALTISLLLTPLIYPDASQTATRLIFTLSVIPIAYLLPVLIPFIKKTYFYLFGLLFILDEIYLFFESYYLIGRMILMVYSLVAISILWLVSRPKTSLMVGLRARKLEEPVIIIQGTIIFYVVGMLANVLGYTVLSNIIIAGSFTTYFSGVLILAGVIVLKSLIGLILISDFTKKLNVVRLYPNDIKKGINQLINISGIVYFAIKIMQVFLIYNPVIKWFTTVLTTKWGLGDVEVTLGNFLAFFITLGVSFFLAKVIRIVLQDEILARLNMKKGVPGAISMMVRIVLVILGILLACSAAGINLSNITIIFGALGVGVGFGLQDIVRNFFSGLIIAFERPIRKGDVIKLVGLNLMGEVVEIGIRATIIKTYDGTEVVVPNGNLTSSEVINCTLSDRNMRRELLIGVEYGTDTNKVLEILNKTVTSNKRVFKKPAPWIIFTGFGESSLNFRVTFWANFDIGMTVLSEVGTAIDAALQKEGITIPYPQTVFHMGSKDVPLPKKTKDPEDAVEGKQMSAPKSKPENETKSQ